MIPFTTTIYKDALDILLSDKVDLKKEVRVRLCELGYEIDQICDELDDDALEEKLRNASIDEICRYVIVKDDVSFNYPESAECNDLKVVAFDIECEFDDDAWKENYVTSNAFYHVTKKSNLESIMKDGLVPSVGKFASLYGEDEKRIYLFPTIDSMETALSSWFGKVIDEEYGEDAEFCALKIMPPEDFPIVSGEVEYEAYSYNTISPKFISFYKDV